MARRVLSLGLSPDKTQSWKRNLTQRTKRVAVLPGHNLRGNDAPVAEPKFWDVVPLASSEIHPSKQSSALRYFETNWENNVVFLPALKGEDALVAKILMEAKKRTKAKEKMTFLYHVRHVQARAKTLGYRFSELFKASQRERLRKRSKQRTYVFTANHEQTHCDFNVLFSAEENRLDPVPGPKKKPPKKVAPQIFSVVEQQIEDRLLWEGVHRVVEQTIERQRRTKTNPARFGLAIVCTKESLVAVRVDFEHDDVSVTISKPVVLHSPTGVRFLARFVCSTSREGFGLSKQNIFELQGLQYIRALGAGGFADVALVHDNGCDCACKMIRDPQHTRLLESEVNVLDKLAGVDGVPTVIRQEDNKLFLSPVGVPLIQRLLTIYQGKSRKAFAERMLATLEKLLAEVHARGVIHGHIRPDNIVVLKKKLCLIDWGGAVDMSQEDKPKGWALFMSDELLNGAQPTPEDDVRAMIFTYLAVLDNPRAQAPWPHVDSPSEVIATRRTWLLNHLGEHPGLKHYFPLLLKREEKERERKVWCV